MEALFEAIHGGKKATPGRGLFFFLLSSSSRQCVWIEHTDTHTKRHGGELRRLDYSLERKPWHHHYRARQRAKSCSSGGGGQEILFICLPPWAPPPPLHPSNHTRVPNSSRSEKKGDNSVPAENDKVWHRWTPPGRSRSVGRSVGPRHRVLPLSKAVRLFAPLKDD